MLRIDVALSSARRQRFEVPESSKVGDLKSLAQKSFGKGFLKLVTTQGKVLSDPDKSLQAAGLQDEDHLTAIVQEGKLAATSQAFALWCCGGDRIVTWSRSDGSSDFSGGDSSQIQARLKAVQEVKATDRAFAAILADGSVVAWGDIDPGGDPYDFADEDYFTPRDVQQVQANDGAFAAIRTDGSVATWGSNLFGGRSLEVQDQLRNVLHIQATSRGAFAAIKEDGSVVT